MSFPPPPFGTVWELATSYWVSRCLHVVADMGVADAVGSEPTPVEAVATKVGAAPDALYRVIRLLASNGVFELRDGKVAHSPASEILKTDHPMSMRAFVRVMGTPVIWKSYGELEHSLRTGHSAVEKSVPEGFFAFTGANPEVARVFDEAMTSKAHAQIGGILGSYEWSQFSKIADIAGGAGHLLKAVLGAAPKATGILFEQPHVIESSKSSASDRLQLQAGDFFKDAPMPCCDGYILMQVLHDWDDKAADVILQSIRRAAPANAKLLVIETIMPDTPGPDWAKLLDIQMLTMHTGRERTRAQYAALLEKAHFKLERVVPTRADVQILEAVRL